MNLSFAIIGGSFSDGFGTYIYNLEGCFMAMYIMKGLCVIGIILNLVLMWRKNKELRANPEKDPGTGLTGEELWARGKQPKKPGRRLGWTVKL